MYNVCIDTAGNVYITDADKRIISMFDASGMFIEEFALDGKRIGPGNDIAVYDDSYIFVGLNKRSYAGSWKGGIFQVYSIPAFEYIRSLGSPDWIKENWGILTATNTIFVDSKNQEIIVSHAYPYLIEIFSLEGRIKRRFGRTDKLFDEFSNDRLTPRIKVATGASFGLTCLPDGIIVNAIRHVNRKNDTIVPTVEYYFDFFMSSGEYLLTVSKSVFGITGQYNIQMEADHKGFIWISHIEPFPHISKYKIDFVKMEN